MEWVKTINPNLNLSVSDIKQIENVDNKTAVFTTSLYCGVIPYGYLVIDVSDGQPIIRESCISKNHEGLYASAVDNIEENRKSVELEDDLTYIAPMQYSVKYRGAKGNSYSVDNYGNIAKEREQAKTSTNYSKVSSIFIKKNNFLNKDKYIIDEDSKIILNKFKNRQGLITNSYIKDVTKQYACGVQALIQIAYMEKFIDNYQDKNVIKTLNNKLWKYTKTTETAESKKENGDIMYGDTYTSDAAKGFVKLAKEYGYTGTEYKGLKKKPSVGWIKDKLKFNRPILMGYDIKVDGKRSGHLISVLGYYKAKKVSSNNTWNYLMVYNSWDNCEVFLNYSCVDMMDCEASYFWVKK